MPTFFYFDLGNVLINFDHGAACRNVARLTGLTAEQARAVIFDSQLEWQYERGDIDSQQFHALFCERTGTRPSLAALKLACSDIFELNHEVAAIVARLHSEGRQLGVLSNTCEAHWEYVYSDRYPMLREHFGVHALSFALRSMKPEPHIYAAAARLAETSPTEIFFVDDRPENVAAAREAGFDAVLFSTAQQLVADLQQRQVLARPH